MTYSNNLHTGGNYNFEMSLIAFLCDEVVPVIKVLVLHTGSNTNARNI